MKILRVLAVPVLIVLVVIIWSINTHFLSSIRSNKSKTTSVTKELSLFADSSIVSDFKFTPIKRDPFNVVIDTTPKEPAMPKFSLRGVIITEDGSLALMQLNDGNVYTMKQGQKYLGVSVKKITSKQVIAEFRGRKVTFDVWQ